MFVKYQWCRATPEGDSAGYVIAADYGHPAEWEFDTLECNESVWMIPGTFAADAS